MTGTHGHEDAADDQVRLPGHGGRAGPVALEHLQAAALSSVNSAVMITDAEGVIVWVNEAFTAMSGYSSDEAVGQTPRILKSGRHDELHYTRLWATILAGHPWRGEVIDRRKDGQHYTVAQTITPIRDAAGAVTHFVAIHEDVSQLRASEARLQALFDHALDAIVLFDDTGRLMDANPAVSDLTGYSRDELTGMVIEAVVPPEDRPRFERARRQLLTRGQVRGSAPVQQRGGEMVEVEYQAVANITARVHLLIARDVTAQRRAEDDQRFQAQLLDAVGDAVIATDPDGLVRYWNPAAEQLYGWRAAEVLGRPIGEVNVPTQSHAQAEAVMDRVRSGHVWSGEFDVARRDGSVLTAWVTNAPYLDADGEVAGIIGASTDITELQDSHRLLARRARQQTAIAQLGQCALTTDDLRAVGAHAEEVVRDALGSHVTVHVTWGAETPTTSLEPDDPGAAKQVRVPIGTAAVLTVHHPDEGELESQDREFLDAVGHIIHAAVQRNVANTRLEHLATHDPVTGLPNRTLFLDRLRQARAASQRSTKRFAVLFLDLDGFKYVNDGLGHDAGDEVLRLVAERLGSVVRPADTVARFGGDEFGILCPDIADEHEATTVAERVQHVLDAGFSTGTAEVTVTASIGVVLDDRRSDVEALLRDADTAMYWAKDSGRNRIERFDQRMQAQALQRFDTAAALRVALHNGGITVAYQPIVELATNEIVGVEALARLTLPSGQVISPDQFIWVAEETGLIGALGEQVLGQACADAARWAASNPAFMLAVNVSPRQLNDHRTIDLVKRIVSGAGIAPSSLWLEITETALLSASRMQTTMRELRELGVKLAIDDFGTGYSSLAHLRQMPVDMLKIDHSFVSGINASIQDHALVSAAIDLARSFSLRTTAEGVETSEQRAELSTLRCDLAQGYWWSPPVSAEAITSMLDAARARP